jgi:predicted thioesterase
VTCHARIIRIDGGVISFQLESRDDAELIARGFHRLRVIQVERLARRIDAKRRSSEQSR